MHGRHLGTGVRGRSRHAARASQGPQPRQREARGGLRHPAPHSGSKSSFGAVLTTPVAAKRVSVQSTCIGGKTSFGVDVVLSVPIKVRYTTSPELKNDLFSCQNEVKLGLSAAVELISLLRNSFLCQWGPLDYSETRFSTKKAASRHHGTAPAHHGPQATRPLQ